MPRWSPRLAHLRAPPIQPDDALIEPGDARIVVFGMGRVGAGAYDELVRGAATSSSAWTPGATSGRGQHRQAER